jgi:hypothetical protein
VMKNSVHLHPSKPIPGKPHQANDTLENFFALFPSLGKRVFWEYSDLFFFARVGRGTRRRFRCLKRSGSFRRWFSLP